MPTRDECITKLVWLKDFRSSINALHQLWLLEHRDRSIELPSIIGVAGTPGEYTDDEVQKLAAFADRIMPHYDLIWRIRRHEHLLLFQKTDTAGSQWERREIGVWWETRLSPSLDEAIKFMSSQVHWIKAAS